MKNIFNEQFFWIALFTFFASILVSLFFLNNLLHNFWNRLILRNSLIFLGPISLIFFIKVLPDYDLISWLIFSFIFILFPFIVTFLYKNKEQIYIEKHKNYFENLGYSKRAIPRKNGKDTCLWKKGTNESILVDKWYRQKN